MSLTTSLTSLSSTAPPSYYVREEGTTLDAHPFLKRFIPEEYENVSTYVHPSITLSTLLHNASKNDATYFACKRNIDSPHVKIYRRSANVSSVHNHSWSDALYMYVCSNVLDPNMNLKEMENATRTINLKLTDLFLPDSQSLRELLKHVSEKNKETLSVIKKGEQLLYENSITYAPEIVNWWITACPSSIRNMEFKLIAKRILDGTGYHLETLRYIRYELFKKETITSAFREFAKQMQEMYSFLHVYEQRGKHFEELAHEDRRTLGIWYQLWSAGKALLFDGDYMPLLNYILTEIILESAFLTGLTLTPALLVTAVLHILASISWEMTQRIVGRKNGKRNVLTSVQVERIIKHAFFIVSTGLTLGTVPESFIIPESIKSSTFASAWLTASKYFYLLGFRATAITFKKARSEFEKRSTPK